MTIETIVVRELRMCLKAPFETSFGVTQNRRILLVEVIVDGVSGWGEVTATEILLITLKRRIQRGTLFQISSCRA